MNQNNILGDSVLSSKWFNPDYLFNKGIAVFNWFSSAEIGTNVVPLFRGILFFLAMFFLVLISYCAVRMFEIRKKEHMHLQFELEEYAHRQKEQEQKNQKNEEISKNPRWVKTLGYLFSGHEGDWKLAIIEADSMLESLMDDLGFKGETLGDKLKSATRENFRSLSSAWEVHVIRNRIAHEGLSYEISEHEAKRVIAIYEQIFREYGYI